MQNRRTNQHPNMAATSWLTKRAVVAAQRAATTTATTSQRIGTFTTRRGSLVTQTAWRAAAAAGWQPYNASAAQHRCHLHTSVAAACAAPPPPRSSKYAQLSDEDVEHFVSILGNAGVITDKDDIAPYNTDWMNKWSGASSLVLRPASTEQVSQILKHCNSRKLAVVPQG